MALCPTLSTRCLVNRCWEPVKPSTEDKQIGFVVHESGVLMAYLNLFVCFVHFVQEPCRTWMLRKFWQIFRRRLHRPRAHLLDLATHLWSARCVWVPFASRLTQASGNPARPWNVPWTLFGVRRMAIKIWICPRLGDNSFDLLLFNQCHQISSPGMGNTDDIFEKIGTGLGDPSTCMSAACAACMALKPGDPIQFKLEIGMAGESCASGTDFMASFKIYISPQICMGGPLGEIAGLLGLDCIELGEVAYYPFLNMLTIQLNSPPVPPLPLPMVRVHTELSLILGDLVDAVKDHCNRHPEGSADQWNCLSTFYEARGNNQLTPQGGNRCEFDLRQLGGRAMEPGRAMGHDEVWH